MTEQQAADQSEWNHTQWGNVWYEGFFAGKKNKPHENPYEGSQYEATWENGYEAGNEKEFI